MSEYQLHALSKAWIVAMVAVTLFLVSVGISGVWNPSTYERALRETLLNNEL
jgi:hypothetical protein